MKKAVMSLGGSLIAPNDYDFKFLSNLKKLVSKQNKQFFFVCGGGNIARKYMNQAKKAGAGELDIDRVGIKITRLNALIVREVFKKYAEEKIILDPTKKITSKKKVVLAAGWRPGSSSDYDVVLLGKTLKVHEVVNLSNTDYVYDKDPKLKGAKPIKEMSWKRFFEIIGTEWKHGKHLPFDPVASKIARKLKMKVVFLNGRKLKNLENYLNGKKFVGTVVQ